MSRSNINKLTFNDKVDFTDTPVRYDEANKVITAQEFNSIKNTINQTVDAVNANNTDIQRHETSINEILTRNRAVGESFNQQLNELKSQTSQLQEYNTQLQYSKLEKQEYYTDKDKQVQYNLTYERRISEAHTKADTNQRDITNLNKWKQQLNYEASIPTALNSLKAEVVSNTTQQITNAIQPLATKNQVQQVLSEHANMNRQNQQTHQNLQNQINGLKPLSNKINANVEKINQNKNSINDINRQIQNQNTDIRGLSNKASQLDTAGDISLQNLGQPLNRIKRPARVDNREIPNEKTSNEIAMRGWTLYDKVAYLVDNIGINPNDVDFKYHQQSDPFADTGTGALRRLKKMQNDITTNTNKINTNIQNITNLTESITTLQQAQQRQQIAQATQTNTNSDIKARVVYRELFQNTENTANQDPSYGNEHIKKYSGSFSVPFTVLKKNESLLGYRVLIRLNDERYVNSDANLLGGDAYSLWFDVKLLNDCSGTYGCTEITKELTQSFNLFNNAGVLPGRLTLNPNYSQTTDASWNFSVYLWDILTSFVDLGPDLIYRNSEPSYDDSERRGAPHTPPSYLYSENDTWGFRVSVSIFAEILQS
ncbi:hypothetical protein BCF59_0501 [Mycoplasmopsis mustelae]|uniref:Uncharacterized protein n=1 Tax=Mycoplasmopsis mustelae TaxID=171289 RepID=A0A4R7UDU7_9BACT|nr:hypothetical protein [Mycoplasmopsis mustelae]TDV23512.1 hypothetical protein BCF59_0501 [Mycoplasmopsis mustelae]